MTDDDVYRLAQELTAAAREDGVSPLVLACRVILGLQDRMPGLRHVDPATRPAGVAAASSG